ncbi:MAG: hypothetical protein NC924_04530 [Candidatus Omnitrophica bacterium]|nr:hypothetical protein [Candidatus Omnitrophota bacterium]
MSKRSDAGRVMGVCLIGGLMFSGLGGAVWSADADSLEMLRQELQKKNEQYIRKIKELADAQRELERRDAVIKDLVAELEKSAEGAGDTVKLQRELKETRVELERRDAVIKDLVAELEKSAEGAGAEDTVKLQRELKETRVELERRDAVIKDLVAELEKTAVAQVKPPAEVQDYAVLQAQLKQYETAVQVRDQKIEELTSLLESK